MIEDAPVEELERLLPTVDILEPLPLEELERLASLSSSMRLEAGEAVALDEDRKMLLLLASGRVRIHEPSTGGGPDLTISVTEEGQLSLRAASPLDSRGPCASSHSNHLLRSSLGVRISRSSCCATSRWR